MSSDALYFVDPLNGLVAQKMVHRRKSFNALQEKLLMRLHENVGHPVVFISQRVAERLHAKIFTNAKLIDTKIVNLMAEP